MALSSNKIKLKYPIAIDWKIAENRLQDAKNGNIYKDDNNIKSSTFNVMVDDIKIEYYLKIYPDDKCVKSGGTSIYLYIRSINKFEDAYAKFTVSIISAGVSQEIEGTTAEFFSSIGGKCCTTDELFDPSKCYIVNGEMNIKIDGYFEFEKEKPIEAWNVGNFGDSLCIDLWNNDDINKDITILVEQKEIKVHKFVMCARSPVFCAMFRSQMKEAQENKVVIQDFTFDIVEAAIKLCYHRNLVPDTSFEDKKLIFQFFDKYVIQSLKDDLETFLISEISESNVCQLSNLSLISNAAKLGVKCSEFLHACLKTSKSIMDFDILDKEFAMKILKNAFRNVSQ